MIIRIFALLAALALFTPAAVSAQDTAPLDRAAVEGIIADYLKSNPQVVVDALEAFQQNQQEAEGKKFKENIVKFKNDIFESSSPTAGNAKGDVTIVEFFDYNCGYCKKAFTDVQTLIKDDKNIKFVMKELPILSETSGLAAQYALAAAKQGKYFEYHTALMEFQGPKSEETLTSLAKDTGLDVEKLKKDAEAKDVKEEIEKNHALARNLGVNGTPAFVIGENLAPGYMGLEAMKGAIADIRAAKKSD